MLSVAVMIFIYVMVLGLSLIVPVYRKWDAYFGVRVNKEFYASPEGRSFYYKYVVWVMAVNLLAAVLLFLYGPSGEALIAAMPAVPMIALAIGWITGFQKLKPHEFLDDIKDKPRAALLGSRRYGRLWNKWVELAYLGIVALTTIVLIKNYALIPGEVPMQWDISTGQPAYYAAKGFGSVFLMPLLGLGLWVMFLTIVALIGKVKLTLPAEDTEAFYDLKRRQARNWIRVLDIVKLAVVIILAFSAMATAFPGQFAEYLLPGIALPMVVMTVGMIVILVLNYRIQRELRQLAGASMLGMISEAKYWYLGLFYVNSSDPSLFVEKKSGMGYTVNLGQAMSWAIIGLIISIPLLISVLSVYFTR